MTGHRDVHLPTERTNSTAILHKTQESLVNLSTSTIHIPVVAENLRKT